MGSLGIIEVKAVPPLRQFGDAASSADGLPVCRDFTLTLLFHFGKIAPTDVACTVSLSLTDLPRQN